MWQNLGLFEDSIYVKKLHHDWRIYKYGSLSIFFLKMHDYLFLYLGIHHKREGSWLEIEYNGWMNKLCFPTLYASGVWWYLFCSNGTILSFMWCCGISFIEVNPWVAFCLAFILFLLSFDLIYFLIPQLSNPRTKYYFCLFMQTYIKESCLFWCFISFSICTILNVYILLLQKVI